MERRIVAIIGSSKFKDQQIGVAQALTLNGCIVLVPGFWHHVDKYPIDDAQKAAIDRLTLDKIALAHEVVVVNPNGYIGVSTQRGIDHAKSLGKPITYKEKPL
jgi:hypothetical protein